MSENNKDKKIYIVLSSTPSIVARLIRIFTREKYSHSSLSLTEDLQWMYSFGRTHPYNPFHGGFVRESPDISTFKRFPKSHIAVLEVGVSAEQLEGIREGIQKMLLEQKKYQYNYVGLFKAGANIPHDRKEYQYYCSEFISELLTSQNVISRDQLPEIIHPMDFLNLGYNVIYRGKLCDYPSKQRSV